VISSKRWLRVVVGIGVVATIPAIAEAHVLSGSGGWGDELTCLLPAAVLLAVVLLVGRDSKKDPGGKDK